MGAGSASAPHFVGAENQLNVVVEDVDVTNEILVKGRIRGQDAYLTLATITGSTTGDTVDISLVDQIYFDCTVYDPLTEPRLVAAGFFEKPAGSGSGDITNGSNQNTSGVGVFLNKSGSILRFKGVDAGSNKITVTNNGGNNTIDIDVDEANFVVPNTSVTGPADTLARFDGTGVLTYWPDWVLNSLTGLDSSVIQQPNNGAGFTWSNQTVQFDPLQNSPNENWNINFRRVDLDLNSSGFNFGINGNAVQLQNDYVVHQGTGDVGTIVFKTMSSNLGNGTDPITIKGLAYSYGFTSIAANVTLENSVTGYTFQPACDVATISGTNNDFRAFLDASNIPISVSGYIGFDTSPIIGGIKNNSNYVGLQINPNITTFSGNASYTALAVSGQVGTMSTGAWQGMVMNPTVTSCVNANGLYVDMTNVTASGNKYAAQFIGDVSIQGDLQFTGGLNIGQLSSFYAVNAVDSGGGAPTTLDGLVTQVTALNGVTTANVDTIGVNTAMLITLQANSINTSGPLSLGLCALALPCVVETHTGSTLDFMSAATYAISLSGTSTGGTIDNVNICRSVVIPNGITTINNIRGFYYDEPFGSASSNTWGIFIEPANAENFMEKSLAIGTTSQKVSASTVGLEIYNKDLLMDTGDVILGTIGDGIQIKEGSNARMGVSTLVAGTVTVSNTSVTASSRIFASANTTSTGHGALSIENITAGVSFDIVSTNVLDDASVAWLIIEPA